MTERKTPDGVGARGCLWPNCRCDHDGKCAAESYRVDPRGKGPPPPPTRPPLVPARGNPLLTGFDPPQNSLHYRMPNLNDDDPHTVGVDWERTALPSWRMRDVVMYLAGFGCGSFFTTLLWWILT